jgi:hypothetical protein
MPTPRKAIPPTTETIDQYCSAFDNFFGRSEERETVRQYVMGLRPLHGAWQFVEDEAHPPAFTPAEAAQRLPHSAWPHTVRDEDMARNSSATSPNWSSGRPTAPPAACA